VWGGQDVNGLLSSLEMLKQEVARPYAESSAHPPPTSPGPACPEPAFAAGARVGEAVTATGGDDRPGKSIDVVS
jgi:hypothetical protein